MAAIGRDGYLGSRHYRLDFGQFAVMMALLGWLFLKEKLNLYIVGGILLAGLGVILVVSKGDLRAAFSGGFGKPGDILILISAPIWAVYSILSCPVLERHSPLKVTFYTFLFGWLMSNLFFVFGAEWTPLNHIPVAGWLNMLYLGAFCSAFSFMFYNNSLQILPPRKWRCSSTSSRWWPPW